MATDGDPRGGALWRPAIVYVAALWLMAGALMKLFLGSPNGLPEAIKALPGPVTAWFPVLIGIELAVAWLVLLRMRWGWPLLAVTLAVFVAILSWQLTQGATSCGCFGDSITIHPGVMLAVDGALLLGVLAAKPWSARQPIGAGAAVLVLALAVSLAAPWLAERAPEELREKVGIARRPAAELDVASWPGQSIDATDLAGHLDVTSLPIDAICVLYRMQCGVCAEHLAELSVSNSQRPMEEQMMNPIVLIRIFDPSDSPENAQVTVKPEGEFVMEFELPRNIDFVVTTPHEFHLREWVVQPAEG